MCRGENVQCKECSRLSTRIVQLCIRGELMSTCPETIIEGVSLVKEECRLCRYGSAKGKIIMPPSTLAHANNYDREAWRASKEQPMPQPVPKRRRLKPQNDTGIYSNESSYSSESQYSIKESKSDVYSWLGASEELYPKKTNHLQSSCRVEIKFMIQRTEPGRIREEQTMCEQLV
ncbi:hypothetical protein FSARC_5265 [Fusarium sarcochroum]|uniref:Uncharacterized protein n=1 Tax=Fusarium sarcochroum TaxID=1208366 RepID=A0A8H4XAE9_9HYPO|nr:hypothetical protein FSARC_5265 [Fusarium sarcochroum]